MTGGVAGGRPTALSQRARLWFAAAGGALVGVVLVPPISGSADHYLFVEAVRFSILALVAPALVVVGAPWRCLGLAPATLDRLAEGRRRHPNFVRSLGFLVVDLVVVVLWRTPPAVDAVSQHGALVLVEAATLVAAGAGLWLELVESLPLVPRSIRPRRAVLAALAMWTIWTIAYTVAMSHHAWYRGFHHVSGAGLSASADHQLSTVVLWAVAAMAFMPVIFWNLLQWLRSEDDPDHELFRLVREDRRRSAVLLRSRPGDDGGLRG
jgi:cytochrome c oxidase assembly factor CtaG